MKDSGKCAFEPVAYIPLISGKYTAKGYAAYQWVKNTDPPAWKPMIRPLARTRLALAASGGIYAVGQTAFHYKDDTSFRAIPVDIPPADLRVTHFAFDLTESRKDPNIVFPLAALKRLVQKGMIGALTDHAFTFMGGIYSARKVSEELAPALAEVFWQTGPKPPCSSRSARSAIRPRPLWPVIWSKRASAPCA